VKGQYQGTVSDSRQLMSTHVFTHVNVSERESKLGLQTGTRSIGPDRAGPGPPDGLEDRDFFYVKT
jgi:hypothetical protein